MKKISAKHIFIFVAIGALYFAGVAAMLYPMFSNILSLSTSQTVISDYNTAVDNMPAKEIDDRLSKAKKYNADIASGNYSDGLEKSLCDSSDLMCYVDIPTISVYLPVYFGTSEEVLAKGCGYVENTSLPVGGKSTHTVLSAHTGLPSADMFTKLDQVEMNDIFYIHVLDEVLAYKVEQIKTVYPYETENLLIVPDQDYATLLTCTPYGINDHRLLVRGTRIPYSAAVAASAGPAQTQGTRNSSEEGLSDEIRHQMTVITAVAIVAVIIYVFALIWLLHSIRARSASSPGQTEESDVSTQQTN